MDTIQLPITALFAAASALLFFLLALVVVVNRARTNVSIGDGGDDRLALAVRIFGNFTEYVPLTLVLMTIVEINGAPTWQLYTLGGLLVAGRMLHVVGLKVDRPITVARVAGIAANWFAILGGGVLALLQFLAVA
jgi:uncharacterized membrane protein YecN with MAPEG domain